MSDYLYMGRLADPQIAFSFAVTTSLVNDAVLRHNCGPVSGHMLGRALTAGLLSASILGKDERINIRWQYEGLLKTLIVDADNRGDVRGFVSPKDLIAYESEKHEVFGPKGKVTVVRSNKGRVLNSGTSEARLHDVVDDLAFFSSVSDQLETGMSVMIGLAPNVERPVQLCQGFMIQALPECDLEQFDQVRTALNQPAIRDLMALPTDADTHFETVINAITSGVSAAPGITIGHSVRPVFQCTCSREKMAAVLRTVPADDRESLLQENESVVVSCQFCNQRFSLSHDECRAMWRDSSSPSTN